MFYHRFEIKRYPESRSRSDCGSHISSEEKIIKFKSALMDKYNLEKKEN